MGWKAQRTFSRRRTFCGVAARTGELWRERTTHAQQRTRRVSRDPVGAGAHRILGPLEKTVICRTGGKSSRREEERTRRNGWCCKEFYKASIRESAGHTDPSVFRWNKRPSAPHISF